MLKRIFSELDHSLKVGRDTGARAVGPLPMRPRRLPRLSISCLMSGWCAIALFAPVTGLTDPLSEEVEHLAAHPALARADAAHGERREASRAAMIELNEIPAPPFGEAARAQRFAEMLTELGLHDVRQDAVGNVLGRRAGRTGHRTVAVIAHLDTVFPQETDVSVRREGDTYAAPGIGDNSRGLALLLDLVNALEQAAVATQDDVLFVGSVGEEGLGDLRGVRHLFGPEGVPIDSAIVIDGGHPHRIVTTAVGSNRYRVRFNGPGGHSYGSFGRAHPHQALADAITRFTEAASGVVAREGEKATFSVGRIGGGTSINSIPFESWMEVDMRSPSAERLAALDQALHTSVEMALEAENARRTGAVPLTVDIEPVGMRPAGRTAESSPLVRRAVAAWRAVGLDVLLSASSTDANVPMAMGIPAITISRGGMSRNAHALNESWQDVNAGVSFKAALLLLIAEAGLAVE